MYKVVAGNIHLSGCLSMKVSLTSVQTDPAAIDAAISGGAVRIMI